MNDESKKYQKAVGAAWCDQTQKWILACAEKTDKGPQIKGFAAVSDGIAIVPEAEKLSRARINDEQKPILLSLGADTAQMCFFAFSIPVMDASKQEAVIAAQAESILPMSPGQSVFTWRIVKRDSAMQNGFLSAVRKGYFQELTGVATGKVDSMMPDATGLVRAWSLMFESTSARCVLVKIRKYQCILALCEDGKLIRAAGLDWQGSPETMEPVAGEIVNLVQSMEAASSVPFYITGPDRPAGILCSELVAAGKTVSLWKLSQDKLRSLGLSGNLPAEIIGCPEAAGLALASLEEEPAEFDFIRKPIVTSSSSIVIDKKSLIRSIIWTAAALAIFLFLYYWTARRELSVIQKALSQTYGDTTGEKILSRQQTRERFARARPDMLELLTILNTCAGDDVMIDTFNFKKGQPVRLTAKARSFEQVNAFQKKLQEQNGISAVKQISPTMDEKKGQVQFTLTFSYKNFSR